jgi:hypothetical protein
MSKFGVRHIEEQHQNGHEMREVNDITQCWHTSPTQQLCPETCNTYCSYSQIRNQS